MKKTVGFAFLLIATIPSLVFSLPLTPIIIPPHPIPTQSDPQTILIPFITTVAGNGTQGYSGNGGPATLAQLYFPSSVACDHKGNLYIADGNNNVIRKVTNGIITTVAGSTQGFSGDNGPATSAKLNSPTGVACDYKGNLYIADRGNKLIRKVTNGTITTVAGHLSGVNSGGDGGPATLANFLDPSAVACDSQGNIYIADELANTIRKVTDGTITTVAGIGNASGAGLNGYSGDGGPATLAELYLPTAIALDLSDNLYIADTNNDRVRKVTGGIITTVAGNGRWGYSGNNGPATSAKLNAPSGIVFDPSGNLYISDLYNHVVRKVTHGTITTVAGNGASGYSGDGGLPTSARMTNPVGLAFISGDLFIADMTNERVRKLSYRSLRLNGVAPE